MRGNKCKRGFDLFFVTRGGLCAVFFNMNETREQISPEVWEAVKIASIRGVPDVELSEQFGVTREAIRQRRFRDKTWAAAVSPISMLHNEERKAEASRIVTGGVETDSLAQKVAQKVSESAESISTHNLLLASQIARKGLQRASGEIDALPIENIADIERIFKMAAIAGKWNQPQVSVNQAFAFGGGQDDAAIVECETEIVEDSGNYGDAFNMGEDEA